MIYPFERIRFDFFFFSAFTKGREYTQVPDIRELVVSDLRKVEDKPEKEGHQNKAVQKTKAYDDEHDLEENQI